MKNNSIFIDACSIGEYNQVLGEIHIMAGKNRDIHDKKRIRKPLTLYLSREVLDYLDYQSKINRRSLASQVALCLEEALKIATAEASEK